MLVAIVLGLMFWQASGSTDEKVPYPLSGNGLLAHCEKFQAGKGSETDAAMCAGYIQGVADAVSAFDYMLQLDKSSIEAAGPLSCIPGGTTYEQHVRVIVKCLRDHPAQLHRQRLVLAVAALRAAFPCPKAN